MEIEYIPITKIKPEKLIGSPTAWNPNELILLDIIRRFKIVRGFALEFGVDYGYSLVALSNFFERVVGVDTFEGDENAGQRPEDFYKQVKKDLEQYPNIKLLKSDYRDFIKALDENGNSPQHDLIHVDIVHRYDETYECGLWSAKHAKIVLFHDTESFPGVKKAVEDIAKETGMKFYNYKERYGLGILSHDSIDGDNK